MHLGWVKGYFMQAKGIGYGNNFKQTPPYKEYILNPTLHMNILYMQKMKLVLQQIILNTSFFIHMN